MQVRITVRCLVAPTRMAVLRTTVTSGGEEVEKSEPSSDADRNVKWELAQLLWKNRLTVP